MRSRKSVIATRSRSTSYQFELLEDRRLLSATLTVSQSLMVFNAVKNSAASPVETLTLTNTGNAALSLNGLAVVNDPSQTAQSAARFSLLNASGAPTSLAAGASFGLQIDYNPTAKTLDEALLNISSSDPANGLQQVQLHGIGTPGTGGGNQPSLERILQAYDEPNYANVGETDPTSAYYPEPPAAGSDEVGLQELVKAGTGPVTINVLASFTAASTKPYTLGWYNVANPGNSQQQLFYTPTSESQSLYVQPQGVTSFDPGSTVFGFYNPSATVKVNNVLVTGHTQDDLNTWDTTDQRKFRFFPLETSNGTIVPNSYIMTSTEYYTPAGYDFTNLVAIVSNVMPAPSAPSGPVLSISNPVALPGSNTLIFNRIQNPNTTVGDTVHDTNTITLENTGQGNLTVSNITVAATTGSNGGIQYQLVNPPAFPFTLTAGQTQTVEVQFVLSQANANSHSSNETNSAGNGGGGSVYPGVLTITSNDADNGTTTIPLEGWWQEHSENENEPDLQTMVNLMAGWDTEINPSQINFLNESTASGSTPIYYGEEVVSAYWAEADSTQPVGVIQLAAYHSQGDTSGLNYLLQGSTSTHSILNTGSDVGQTFFPLNSAGTNVSAGSFSTTSSFGFEALNPNTYSDDTKNVGDAGGGHLIRFYPVRDASGNLISNTYILANDYPNGSAENFDYQDNVYLISNIHPVATTAVSQPQTTGGAAAPAAVSATQLSSGVSLQWTPVSDTTVTGYSVYSSLSPTTGYTLLNSTPVTSISYLDTTALPGETVYYRVAAINSLGVGLGTQASVVTNGTASTNLQSIAIGESPSGSTTTVTPNQAYTLVAGGPGVTGTTDGFRYLFAAHTGDFDVAAQVSSLTVAGSYSTAGIMARDSLSTTGANVYMSASPINYRFKYRTADGGTESVSAGTTQLNYPDVWVRLTRAGNVFSGYTSVNGVVWTLMGQETLSNFSSVCYLGLAVAANTTSATTTAQVTNYGTTPVYTGPVTMPATYSAVSGQTVQESVLANDVDLTGTIQPGTFTITMPPSAGGTVSFDSGTDLLTYTSVAGFVGTETMAYTIADNNNAVSSPTTVTFNVSSAGPVAADDSFVAVAGKLTQFNVLSNDTDATSTLNPASIVIQRKPTSGGTLVVNSTTGAITYLAPATFSGIDTFTYSVADYAGQISSPAAVTVDVSPSVSGNLATSPATAMALTGTATTINVLGGDTDTSTIVASSVKIVLNPALGGTATVNGNGTITYTSAAGFTGVETFLYTVKDSAGYTSAATLVSVTVAKAIPAPMAIGTTGSATANGTLSTNVTDNVQSVAGLNLSTLAVGTSPKHGIVAVDTTTGVMTYTPAKNFVGPDSYSYTVADVNGKVSNVAIVEVNVGVSIGNAVGNDRSLTFTNSADAATTVSLNRGSVQVLFNNDATLSVDKSGRATVTGSALQISDLQLSNTTVASTLSVSVKGKSTFNIGGISDSTPIKTISAPNAVLSGAVDLNGVATLQVSQVANAQLMVGSGVASGFTLATGALNDSSLSSTIGIRAIKASSWNDSTAGTYSITAPSIGSLVIAGNFAPLLTLTGGGTALKLAQIKGTLTSATVAITGNVGTFATGSLGSTVHANVLGSVNNLTVRGGGVGGTLNLGSINTLNVVGNFSGVLTAGSARTIHVVGDVTAGASIHLIAAGTSLNALSVSGSITGATLIVAGNAGSVTANSLFDDTILIGANAGTTLSNVDSSNLGIAKLGALHLTGRKMTTFSTATLIVHTLGSANVGVVDTENGPGGIALFSAGSITGTENSTAFRFNGASKASDVFGQFEIDLIT